MILTQKPEKMLKKKSTKKLPPKSMYAKNSLQEIMCLME